MPASGNDVPSRTTDRFRVLTPAERVLVRAILAGEGAGAQGLPRSTRKAATTRIYVRDWIRDRYVPNPSVAGWPFITFALSQPFADALPLAASSWQESPAATMLWGSYKTLFGVFFSRTQEDRARLWIALSDPKLGRGAILLGQNLAADPVPVYFDFEAAWARVAGGHGTHSYPQSLPRFTPPPGETTLPRLSRSEEQAMVRLASRPFIGPPRAWKPGSGFSPLFGGVEGRCLRRGLVELRSFLNPVTVARDIVQFPKRVAFVHGDLVGSSTPDGLFRELVESVGASPFLFATEGRSVLIGALSEGHRTLPGERATSGEAALAVLKKHLGSIVVVEEDLANVQVLLVPHPQTPFDFVSGS